VHASFLKSRPDGPYPRDVLQSLGSPQSLSIESIVPSYFVNTNVQVCQILTSSLLVVPVLRWRLSFQLLAWIHFSMSVRYSHQLVYPICIKQFQRRVIVIVPVLRLDSNNQLNQILTSLLYQWISPMEMLPFQFYAWILYSQIPDTYTHTTL